MTVVKTEIKKRLPIDSLTRREAELAQFLLDRLSPDEIEAAQIYLKVEKSRQVDPRRWSLDTGEGDGSWFVAPRTDLLYRSIWFAEDHVLTMPQAELIFDYAGMFRRVAWTEIELRAWIHSLIQKGILNLRPDLKFELSTELSQGAENRLSGLTHNE